MVQATSRASRARRGCLWGLLAGVVTGCLTSCDSGPEHAYPPPRSDGGWDAAQADGAGDGAEDGADGQACAARSCIQLGAECGDAPDGCGGVVECGECAVGQQCGGGGLNKCGTDECTPKTCTQLSAACGLISDGCGKTLSCGSCTSPDTCGGGGQAYQCGCEPATCLALRAECGPALDGCGAMLDCGGCPSGQVCGGGEVNKCSDIPCQKDTCESIGAACGMQPDGCDSVIDCGDCATPQTCGGGGQPAICGCTPTTCSAQAAECGSLSDGCGSTLACGSCQLGSCQNNQCVCTPTTCAAEGADCGTIADGCGATLTCGTCTTPKQCAASGVANLCGCNPTICPPFYANSFEAGSDFPAAWVKWHNCPADANWSVQITPYPAAGGGASNLRLHTTAFQASCNWPGAYAQSPSLPAAPGKTYRAESVSRHGGAEASGTILFFDANDDFLSQYSVLWPADTWVYEVNPPSTAVAPPGTTHLQFRVSLTAPESYMDFDLLAVYEEP